MCGLHWTLSLGGQFTTSNCMDSINGQFTNWMDSINAGMNIAHGRHRCRQKNSRPKPQCVRALWRTPNRAAMLPFPSLQRQTSIQLSSSEPFSKAPQPRTPPLLAALVKGLFVQLSLWEATWSILHLLLPHHFHFLGFPRALERGNMPNSDVQVLARSWGLEALQSNLVRRLKEMSGSPVMGG